MGSPAPRARRRGARAPPGRCRPRPRPAFAARGGPRGLAAILALAPGGPVHVHAAEQVAEVEEVLAHLGARPVEWLLDNAPVDRRWCLIHATQMLPAETAALAASGAVAGLCPITESSLGDGIFDGAAYLGAGGTFGVGSDSNIRISLSEELRTLEYSQRLRDRARAVLARPDASTGRVLFEGAARGGRPGGRPRLPAPSPPASGPTSSPSTARRSRWRSARGDTILDAFVFAGDDRLVRDVWSAGRRLVTAGRHHGRDEIVQRYRATRARLGAEL